MAHKHEYKYRRPVGASVEFCACGAWRFTSEYLAKNPPIIEQRKER